jgi:diguanylate cyclase (GGDEF)-like protein
MIDLDHFKQVNDTHGHPAGDAVLRHVAALVRQTLRSTDVPSRYGGEEFVVILPETGREHAEKVAEKIRATVQERPAVYKDLSIPVTVSIGVATWSHEKPVAPETLISRADEAVYRAKTEGRNRVCVFGGT